MPALLLVPPRSLLSSGPMLCSLAMALVGSTVLVSQLIAADMAPFLATALRHALALPVFLWLLSRQARREPGASRLSLHWPGWHDGLLLLLQAAAGSVGYTVLLMLGVQRCGAADAGIVSGALPAVAGLFAWLFLGERTGWRLLAALGLATAGVMTVAVAPAAVQAGPGRAGGIALVLAAIACEAVFILASKRLRQPLPPLQLSACMSAGGLLLSLLPAIWGELVQPSHFSAQALAGVAYYAWVPTVGGFLLWYAGSARTSGVRAALSTAWLPVSALLLAALWLGQVVQLHQWAGLACVLLAVGLAARR